MTYMVSREAAGSVVAFFDSMHNRLAMLMEGAPIGAPPPRVHKRAFDDDSLRALVAQGLRLEELSRRCGCSTPIMRRRLHRIGILAVGMHPKPGSKRTKERRQRGLSMLLDGATITEVARACGVTKPSVMKWRELVKGGAR